jgi:hypothetical protein
MSNFLPATLGIAVALIASTALATERSELEKSSIKAATDCVAAAALNNPNITKLHRENRLKEVTDWIVLKSDACDNPLRAMRLLHDRLYGEGTGRRFLRRAYLADLPRAVGERISDEVEKREVEKREALKSYASVPPILHSPSSPNASQLNGEKRRYNLNHNDSEMVLIEDIAANGKVAIYYRSPRNVLREIGVREGTLLFRGTVYNRQISTTGLASDYSGTAFTFQEGCAPIPYRVNGTWSQSKTFMLEGPAPEDYDGCRPTSYSWNHNSQLRFNVIETGSEAETGYPPYRR